MFKCFPHISVLWKVGEVSAAPVVFKLALLPAVVDGVGRHPVNVGALRAQAGSHRQTTGVLIRSTAGKISCNAKHGHIRVLTSAVEPQMKLNRRRAT